MKSYLTEREGQIEFFKNFRIDYENKSVLVDNTDGIWNGNLLEFKLNINDLNKVLFQAIKYLSRMRIKGESIPANILLISLNTNTLYLYHSQDYFDEIHKIYIGAASNDNEGFSAKPCVAKYDYLDMKDSVEIINLLKSSNYMPISLDENCIVGWAERYYKEFPDATKGDFLGDDEGKVKIVGEIREPKRFKGLILPYRGKTNEKFKYLMDKLNDRLKKKDLGAFYTPIPYCEKAVELVRMAIKRVPEGNDYIILDRCAGTGNLESVLTDEELSHCILSTYEYYEYKVLVERLGDKVRCIIPPTEAQVEYSNGCVMNADAMSKEYIENPILQGHIQDPKCTIILYENPPYSESGSIQYITDDKYTKVRWKNSFVFNEFSKEIKGTAKNEMSNLFIWSGFKYFLRQNTDSYILFSPIKYWKSQHIIDKKYLKSFIFNRIYFHATASAITCILWSNENKENDIIESEVFDIVNNSIVKLKDNRIIKKVHTLLSSYYDKDRYDNDEKGIACAMDGYEGTNKRISVPLLYNKNIIGYLISQSFGFENPRLATNLLRCSIYNGHGFYLRRDNYLKKLPLFAAGKYPIEDIWHENGILYKSFDGGDKFVRDKEFLKYCLIFTCLSYYNKCLSFKGSDGREYQNELCFDKGALALFDLEKMELNKDEKELITLWNKILKEVKKTKNYDSHWRYGVYQITKELNTYTETGKGKKKDKKYDYPELNGDLNTLKAKLKQYYKKYISPKMFEYELIK